MSKRKIASNTILFLFFVLVGLSAYLSHLFQAPLKNGPHAIDQLKLFSSAELEQTTKIVLKNKSGEYSFERSDSNQISPWHMVSPRDLTANSPFIEKLFNSLTTIKIKKIFPDEKINYSNFSLDKPTSTLTLLDQEGKAIVINIGLMNTIDNSTYLKVVNRNGIYHVDAPSVSLEKATLLDLIESQIISINPSSITALRIYRSNKKNLPQIEIKRNKNDWVDRDGNILSPEKIADFFQDLSSLKSSFILDKQTDSQKKQIKNLIHSPDYVISIEDSMGNTIDYNISGIIREMSELDLKNEEYFVVSISDNSTAYIVKKEFYELFNKKVENLKATTIPDKKNVSP